MTAALSMVRRETPGVPLSTGTPSSAAERIDWTDTHSACPDRERRGGCRVRPTVRGDRGPIAYPQIVGHEIVGRVAAVWLCAGLTTYSPLRHWNAGPGSRVGVIGMGGLGHRGVKLAVALGADVTVLSRGTGKRDDDLAFGASCCVATTDAAALSALTDSSDLIIDTVSAGHGIHPETELITADGINGARERVLAADPDESGRPWLQQDHPPTRSSSSPARASIVPSR